MVLENYIWLRYRNPQTGANESERFDALDAPRIKTAREGQNIEGNRAVHPFTFYITAIYMVSISANELYDPLKRDYVIAFWNANQKYISLDPAVVMPADTEFIEVVSPMGPVPESYIDDIVELPDWEIELTELKRRVWDNTAKKWVPVTVA